jgi:transposase
MAPNLHPWKLKLIHDLIENTPLTIYEIADTADCTPRTVTHIRSNMSRSGSAQAPTKGVGPQRRITPPMSAALRKHLQEHPHLYLDEMATFLRQSFNITVSPRTVGRELENKGWSKKVIRQISNKRNADLRDFYLFNLSQFRSYHLVYVDESGCDQRAGRRRTGWSPRGVTPVQLSEFQRGQRYQILPAYAQDGIVLSQVFQGSTDSTVFENYIEQLLHHCGRWPAPKSVLVMDNASFHHTDRIKQMCSDAGVKLVYLPPYSPDLNPIEEFFSELKAFIKRSFRLYLDNPSRGFHEFLQWCIDIIGAREQSARGHFRHSGITIDEL